jgi:hypothetical protein
MIPTAIGITKKNHPFGSAQRRLIQDFLMQHGLQPYMPQCAYLSDGNIASAYTHGVGLTTWSEAAWTAVKLFSDPMIFHFGGYWLGYGSTISPSSFRWKGGDGKIRTLDLSTEEELTQFWSDIGRQMDEKRVSPGRWVMIDEPPHTGKYGLTPEIEARVKKVVACLVRAGWRVGVCVPGPKQFAYWHGRIKPARWLLGAKHDLESYVAEVPREQWGDDIWLYNRTANGQSMEGLAEQIAAFGARGYLHWSADTGIGTEPLLELTMRTSRIAWTATGEQLLKELAKVEAARREKEIDDLVKQAQTEIARILQNLVKQISAHASSQ